MVSVQIVERSTYEHWDLTLPPVSERSFLYSLNPIGIGTAAIESFTSYIIRLAHIHQTYPGCLIDGELLPCMDAKSRDHWLSPYRQNRRLDAGKLLHDEQVTTRFVEIVKTLTFQSRLMELTLLPLTRLVSPHHLLHPVRVWCPLCWHEWAEMGHSLYNPLLWMFYVVTVCPYHQRPLRYQCPRCFGRQGVVERFTRPGRCSRCSSWLGTSRKQITSLDLRVEDLEQQIQICSDVTELVVASPCLVPDQYRSAINNLRQRYQGKSFESFRHRYSGSHQKFSRELSVLEILLRYSYDCQQPLLKLLLLECASVGIA